ncbi:Cytoplasmic tRNA 2-thiolation protein 2, partial [Cryomyces antarcticus]
LKQRYPQNTYSMISIADAFGDRSVLDMSGDNLELHHQVDGEVSKSNEAKLEDFLASTSSATSRADILNILRTRLTVRFAEDTGCEGVLWGDCTTRLAEKTLAETAKGRGFTLPWQTADDNSPYGVSFNYPMRDLLKKELVAHADIVSPPLTSLISNRAPQVSASTKNTTIDELMRQYFESVEENYPSIVANVVRTSSKLRAPILQDTDRLCGLCRMPVAEGLFGIHGWGGDQEAMTLSTDAGSSQDSEGKLCYGCARSLSNSTALRMS